MPQQWQEQAPAGEGAASIGGDVPYVGFPLTVGVAVLEYLNGAIGAGGAHDVDRPKGGGDDNRRGNASVGAIHQVNAHLVIGEDAVLVELMVKPLAKPALVPSTSIKSVASVVSVASAAPGWL